MTIKAKQDMFRDLPPEIYGHWTTDKINLPSDKDTYHPYQGRDDILDNNPFVTNVSCEEAILQIQTLRATRKLTIYDYD